jgi:sucrose-6-phosphate hydrolase SacC (GH32 family)
MTKVKVFKKVKGSRSWYQTKGLARRNTHEKYMYESPRAYQLNVMTKVKVFKKNFKVKDQRVRVVASNERSC